MYRLHYDYFQCIMKDFICSKLILSSFFKFGQVFHIKPFSPVRRGLERMVLYEILDQEILDQENTVNLNKKYK